MIVLALVGGGTSVVSFLATQRELGHMKAAESRSETANAALRNHLEMDMMHDALRGDAYRVVFGEAAERGEATRELREHAANLRARLEANRKLELSSDIQRALEATVPVVDKYVDQAERLAASASRDAASPDLAEFQAGFLRLEVELEKVADLIERNAKESGDQLVESSEQASLYSAMFALVNVVGIAVGLYLLAARLRALGPMTEAARKLARGDIEQRIPEDRALDEVSDLGDALRSAMDGLREMAALADDLARGEVSRRVVVRSDADVLAKSFSGAQEALRRVTEESQSLIVAAADGQLSVRSDANRHEGAFKRQIELLNNLMATCAAPIAEATRVLGSMASRDLSVRMSGAYKGAWRDMQSALNEAMGNLDGALRQVAVAADQVGTAASEITIGNQSLAEAATQQASSLDTVAGRMQELNETGKASTDNAKQARHMAQAAQSSAESGGRSMDQLSRAMEEIKQASARTAAIVKTIDEIAFQTNLLALNAAVEAARAGDAGKGFAVVAEEVRNLAMRSAEAARSTSTMIADAVRSAEQGVAINATVGTSFVDIQTHVGRVVAAMEEIANAMTSQAKWVSNVNEMVDELGRTTQQNAATTEQSASAAEELNGQASSLRALVEGFRLTGESEPTRGQVARIEPAQPRPLPRAAGSDLHAF